MTTSKRRCAPVSHTAFVSPKVQLDVLEAMQQAIRQGHSAYLMNRRRRPWLRVSVMRDSHGRRYFQFLDRQGRTVGHSLRRAVLDAWNLFFRRQFLDLEQALLPRGDERTYAAPPHGHISAATNVTLFASTQENVNAMQRRRPDVPACPA